jgi:hypothetical protein
MIWNSDKRTLKLGTGRNVKYLEKGDKIPANVLSQEREAAFRKSGEIIDAPIAPPKKKAAVRKTVASEK